MMQICSGLQSGDYVIQQLGAMDNGLQVIQEDNIGISDESIKYIINLNNTIQVIASGNRLIKFNLYKKKIISELEFPSQILHIIVQNNFAVVHCGEKLHIISIQSFQQITEIITVNNIQEMINFDMFQAYLIITQTQIRAQSLSSKDTIATIQLPKQMIIRQIQQIKEKMYILTEDNKVWCCDFKTENIQILYDIQSEIYDKQENQEILRLTRSFFIIDDNTYLIGTQHGELFLVNNKVITSYKLGKTHISDIKQINEFYFCAIHGADITIFALDKDNNKIYIVSEQNYDYNITQLLIYELQDNMIEHQEENGEEEYYEEE